LYKKKNLSKLNSSKNHYVLGISAYYHDSAAALVKNGEIVAASQQERYSRIKHDASFPIDAIKFCLNQANIELESVDAVVFYDKPLLKFERLLETYLANAPRGYRSFVNAMPIWLKEKLYLKKVLKDELALFIYTQHSVQNDISISSAKSKLKKHVKLPTLLFCEHHQSHAAAAYYPSPFDNAAIVCLDGVGEWATSSIWSGKGGELTPIQEIQFPHSLGLLYSAFTQYCGFKVNSGEYKLMGLAPYGEPKYVDLIYQHLIDVRDDASFTLNMKYFDFAIGKRMTNQAFHDLFGGPAHAFDAPMTHKQMDLAKSIQVVTEDIVLKIVGVAFNLTQSENLCLAGGVALNCVANGRVQKESKFKNLWIQPAAGDAGSALGAALQVWHQYFEQPKYPLQIDDYMQGAYLGDSFTHAEVIQACKEKALIYQSVEEHDLYKLVANLLTQDKVIGWFQDKMEFGPRALGNRSILGDPRSQNMQRQMNLKIKQRESFRPFAPAVLEEDLSKWFDISSISPYMLLTAPLQEPLRITVAQKEGLDKLSQIRSELPAITHVDYSARVQTVSLRTNPKFHLLITEFKALTGVGVLINTSFNVRGEPPVCTPYDAIRSFLATEMDVLVMQNVVLYKEQQADTAIVEAKQVVFEKD
jgi:carbamoyltransferase